MKLAAIYCVWGDANDLLKHSIGNIEPVVDGIIVMYSYKSNFGNYKEVDLGDLSLMALSKMHEFKCEPNLNMSPHENETVKRNVGLKWAKELGYTHFIMLDADEFYDHGEFTIERDYMESHPDVNGMVCKTKVYFKKPTLTVGYDHTLVPFIHKLTLGLRFQLNNKTYPFAYDKEGNAHIDPTRRLNITTGVQWSNITMHHYSWVRSDYDLKIENSAARNNLKKSSIYRDLDKAAPGVYNEFYRAELKECENIFNLPEL